ncbi:rod shape-determining protein MreD [Thiomicrorhabdus sp. ZW0627]|uniref:rod shape-determining protein MreD n=1 Tax=Thiomicrorhabdus sp. ZW0627 TaxID=3039774 RepID=UPI002436AE96|nr:rod shape-determining protein MreD [Thiomicrorhabdus sp. ZW0627]MDG6773499.1 rod shape-determining protein MreD [Thiomicrorhabdus sp. ZW0627]
MTDRFIDLEFSQARWLVLITYFLGLTLDTMMSMQDANLLAPSFTLMFLMYWSAQFLKNTHFLSAFLLGLFLDALYGTTLGAHSLILIVITFIMLRYRLLFRSHSVLQQAFVIIFYLMAYQFISYVMFSPTLDSDQKIEYWLMPFTSLIAWPILALSLRWVTQRLITA